MRWMLLPLLVACNGGGEDPAQEPDGLAGTTLVAAGDTDFDGVPDGEDCGPDDPAIYPGAHDAPGDGIDADCDGEDAEYVWRGEWNVVDVQALYTTFPILVPGNADGTLDIDSDGEVELEAEAELDPSLTGVPIPIFADLLHNGHAAPLPREDQLMLYLEGLVLAPGIEEVSFSDLECTVTGDDMHCIGTLKALEITLATEVWLERD